MAHNRNNPNVGHILNAAQAKHVYDAMVTLNNVSGIIHVRLAVGQGHVVTVEEDIMTDDVIVRQWLRGAGEGGADHLEVSEHFPDQHAFAAAYSVE